MNVIYTIVGEPFRVWVSELIKGRNDHVAEKNDLMIELDPEIAAAFSSSLNISSKLPYQASRNDRNSFRLTILYSNQGQRRSYIEAWQQEKEKGC